MSKKKHRQSHKPGDVQRKGLSKPKTVALVILLLSITAIVLAQWQSIRPSASPLSLTPEPPPPQTSQTPQLSKEYIYAGDRIIATEEPTAATASTNLALNRTASQSSDYPAAGITADRALNGNFTDLTHTQLEAQPWWQVDLGSVSFIDTIKLWNRTDGGQDRLSNFYVFVSNTPFQSNNLTQTQNQAGVASYYMAGQAGTPSIINMTPNQTGRYVRVQLVGSNYLSLVELQVLGRARTNFALSSNGGVASATSIYNANYAASGAINGERWGLNYGSGGVWHSSSTALPQLLQVDFNSNKSINEIDLFNAQNNYMSPSEPTESMTFTLYGLTSFEVQYWNGTSWATVPGGNVTGNNKVWCKFAFSPITTSKIRVLTFSSPDGWSRISELEAWGAN